MKRLLTLILLLSTLSLRAQDSGTSPEIPQPRRASGPGLKVEYFGELGLHPGLSLGLDYPLLTHKCLTLHWDTDLGGFWHRWNNTSVFLKTSIGTRLAPGPVFVDLNLGLGYMHSWAAGAIYQKADEGGVEKTANWGHPHFRPGASLLLGWDGSKKSKLPWAIHFGPEIYLQSSFNHSFLPHVAARIGFTYKFIKP